MEELGQESIIDKCQIFTPDKYAAELLDYVGYKKKLFGKKILENSCGDGSILKAIVSRYIKSLKKEEKNISEIKKGLERDVYGIELDKVHYENCLKSLNDLALSHGIKGVQWNILNKNTLKMDWEIKFDYIVGNPPYISYKEIGKGIRKELKEKYKSCSEGNFDYCYAFIEESLNCLSDTGKFAYLIPNSIFKNVFGRKLRNVILPSLTKIIDYKSHKVFKNALTTSAVIVCDKNKNKRDINYLDIENNKKIKIKKDELTEKWVFEKIENSGIKRFGDFFNASMCVATLCNKAFVIKKFTEDNQYVYSNDMKIEKKIIKKGASPSGVKNQKEEYIIFPYDYLDGELYKYSQKEFEENYPEATKYLLSHLIDLEKRDSDKSAKWFEYGRSQALRHLHTEKLLISSLITDHVESYILEEDYIPYSGIYIVTKGELSLHRAKQIIESQEFYKYIKKIGKNANGKTLKITAKDINNYYF